MSVVSSLQLLHDLIWDIPVQFQLQLAHYQAQECETIGYVGVVDLRAKQKIVHIKSKLCRPVPLPVFNILLLMEERKLFDTAWEDVLLLSKATE